MLKATIQEPCTHCRHGERCANCKGTGRAAHGINHRFVPTGIADICGWCNGQGKNRCYTCKGKGFWLRKEGMFLCIGGPRAGEFLNQSALPADEYAGYNSSSRVSAHYGRKRQPGESMIWVHRTLLP